MSFGGTRRRMHVSSLHSSLARSPLLVPVGSFALATAGSVRASFVALDRWVHARIGPQAREHDADASPLRARGVVISIDPMLRNEAYFEPGHSFAPYFDTVESTRDRLVLKSRSVVDFDVSAIVTTTELCVERDAAGALHATLHQSSCGGCMPIPPELGPPPKPLSARIVLTRDWFGAREEYAIAFYRLSPYGTFYEPQPTWFRVSP